MNSDVQVASVGVVGAGAMGRGISRVFAAAGHTVRIFDADSSTAEAAVQALEGSLGRQVQKGRISQLEADETLQRISVASGLNEFQDCNLVIEAVVERLDIKQFVFEDLEKIVSPSTILATNTSSLAVGSVFRTLEQRERTIGLHFFNPPHIMKLVEVITGPDSNDTTRNTAIDLISGIGKNPVVSQDAPGFIVNFAGRALNVESLAILQEGIASQAQIDAVVRDGLGFPMGPFELMDLTGI